jgi:hypothetical protein
MKSAVSSCSTSKAVPGSGTRGISGTQGFFLARSKKSCGRGWVDTAKLIAEDQSDAKEKRSLLAFS